MPGKIWTDERRDTNGNRENPKNLLAVAHGGGQVVAVGGSCISPTDCVSRIVTFDGRDWHEVDTAAAAPAVASVTPAATAAPAMVEPELATNSA